MSALYGDTARPNFNSLSATNSLRRYVYALYRLDEVLLLRSRASLSAHDFQFYRAFDFIFSASTTMYCTITREEDFMRISNAPYVGP